MKPYSRGKQVLKTLSDHGPLSHRGLTYILQPKMKSRRLRDALQRLKKHGFVQTKTESVSGNTQFFRLTHNSHILRHLKDKYNISPAYDILPRELAHSEGCAMWAESLKRVFPEAVILRDYNFASNNLAAEVLLLERGDFESRPDLLISLPAKVSQKITIAVEFERTKKSDARLLKKIRKYTNESRLDGVIYICSTDTIGDRIKMIYRSQVLSKTQRIEHYGEYFFMFSDRFFPADTIPPSLTSSSNRNISLTDWMTTLSKGYLTARRDVQFEHSATRG